jgi:hypothetical protein
MYAGSARIVSAMLLTIGLCQTSGCATEVTSDIPGEVGADGALRFASPNDFFTAVDAVSHRKPAELDAWERDIGFMSMRRRFAEVQAQIEAAPASERPGLLAANADLLEPTSAEPERRVRAIGYAALIDARGIYYVAGTVHKVTETDVLTSLDGNPATLEYMSARNAGVRPASASDNGVRIFRYLEPTPKSDINLTASCGATMSGERSTSDRRVKYDTRMVGYYTVSVLGDVQLRYAIEFEFRGYKTTLWWWDSYATTYQTYNIGLSFDYPVVTGYNGFSTQYFYARADSLFLQDVGGNVEDSDRVSSFWVGDLLQNPNDVRAPMFYKLHQETTSRGTFPTRGVMECNFCGDNVCQSQIGENAWTCRSDCGFCGDGVCYPANGEDAGSCYSDCHCGDGFCDEGGGESPDTCSRDCGVPTTECPFAPIQPRDGTGSFQQICPV